MLDVHREMVIGAYNNWMQEIRDGKVKDPCPCCMAQSPEYGIVQVALLGANIPPHEEPPLDNDQDFETDIIDPTIPDNNHDDNDEVGDVISEETTQYDTYWLPDLVSRPEADYLVDLYLDTFYVSARRQYSEEDSSRYLNYDPYELTFTKPTNGRCQSSVQGFIIQVMEDLLVYRQTHNASDYEIVHTIQDIEDIRRKKSASDESQQSLQQYNNKISGL